MTFDADTGRLDVTPDAPAYGTQPRWKAPKLIAAATEKVRSANVRIVHVLAPAPTKAGPAMAAADPAHQLTVPAVTVERRTPPEGYRRAIEAHRQAARPSLAGPGIAEAVKRQTAAIGSCHAGRSPSSTSSWMMRRPRSGRPAPSTAARPRRPRPPSGAGLVPSKSGSSPRPGRWWTEQHDPSRER